LRSIALIKLLLLFNYLFVYYKSVDNGITMKKIMKISKLQRGEKDVKTTAVSY